MLTDCSYERAPRLVDDASGCSSTADLLNAHRWCWSLLILKKELHVLISSR